MGKFGSRSIAFRPKPCQTKNAPAYARKGSFRFFDLPPELRDHILRLILLDLDFAHKDILNLFLTCERLYAEAASIFYYEVLLDNVQLRGTADPFLKGSLTRVAPRQHVRNLIIKFNLKDQACLFGELYAAALSEMAELGRLQHLRLEFASRFPVDDFWGFEDEWYDCHDIRVAAGKGKGQLISAPVFVTKPPFQEFLKFLEESPIPKITLYVDAEDHPEFWCSFHRVHPSGVACGGDWKGKARLLKVHRLAVCKALRGAQPAVPVKKDCEHQ
ncbi:hypothetical protein F4819DRAFT_458336 [Hypoxylon fuscum]|nr:hypothetical protein F4819DRAFT_458336 [Hypoxylon fuscum]